MIFQGESLRDKMIVDKIEDTARKQLDCHIKVSRVLSSQRQRLLCEAKFWYAFDSRREDSVLSLGERRRIRVVYGEVGPFEMIGSTGGCESTWLARGDCTSPQCLHE
jgi:hypothetical protein